MKPLETYKYSTNRQIAEALQIDKYQRDQLMNSKKEYGANSVIRQTVLFRDQIAEKMTSQPSNQHTDDDKPQDVQPVRERPSGNAGEGDYFGNQYAQRNRAKRMTDRVTREKRLREQADPLELGLSRRPSSKVVKK